MTLLRAALLAGLCVTACTADWRCRLFKCLSAFLKQVQSGGEAFSIHVTPWASGTSEPGGKTQVQ
ncbi:hypothetical protein ABID12_000896 [Martelella mangrovi]|uniref:Uncharacterized protein n=1 Tax=Martelella mangrovi TaxID=1397477 RepID=A0ABV2I7S6_9HYPH